MRNKLRIKSFLERVDIGMLLAHSDLKFSIPEYAAELQEDIERYISSKAFIDYWLDNPDLRFAQALISLREEPVCRFIDQLDNTHLFRMIDEANNFKRIYPVKYLLLFERELCDRGFCNVLVSQKALDWASEGAERWNLDILKTILKLNGK